ncbi:hypothetical protein Tco_0506624 [Tanacetum coccineum]
MDPELAQRYKEIQKEFGTPCKGSIQETLQTTNNNRSNCLQTPGTRLNIHTKAGAKSELARDTTMKNERTRNLDEAHYSYMAKIQEVSPEESSSTGQPLEQVDQNAAECVDERAALANLIANLTLDTEENKTILKQLKKANHHAQELEKCKTNLDETIVLWGGNSCQDIVR